MAPDSREVDFFFYLPSFFSFFHWRKVLSFAFRLVFPEETVSPPPRPHTLNARFRSRRKAKLTLKWRTRTSRSANPWI